MQGQLVVNNVKNLKFMKIPLGAVNFITGCNGAGKSALMDAVQLAMEGECSTGARLDRIKLTVTDPCFVTLDWREHHGEWRLVNKKNTLTPLLPPHHSPLLARQFWTLSGKEKWAAIGSVIHGSRLAELEDALSLNTLELKQKRTELQGLHLTIQSQPQDYQGPPIETVLATWRQAKIELENAQATRSQQRLREAQEQDAHTAIKDLSSRIEKGLVYINTIKGQLEQARNDIKSVLELGTQEPVLQQWHGAWKTLYDITCAYEHQQDTSCTGFKQQLRNLQESTQAMEISGYCWLEDDANTNLQQICDRYSTTRERAIESIASTCHELSDDLEAALAQVGYQRRQIDSCQQSLTLLQATLGDVVSDGDFDRLTQAFSQAQQQLDAAQNAQASLKQLDHAQKNITLVTARIQELEQIASNLRQEQQGILASGVYPLEQAMNAFLADCKIDDRVHIAMQSTNKVQSLSVTSDTQVDLVAMNGARQVIYSTALLLAIKKLSQEKTPAILVEAAELDEDSLRSFLEALTIHSGNCLIFVSHWLDILLPSINHIVLTDMGDGYGTQTA